ncbi:MAG TPA: hypothetical protein VNN62_01175 [Methylomirabilota bacterium]|jgi:hypothetical protein|nr:hypothetical protein [Methylomirabilota bacterium]
MKYFWTWIIPPLLLVGCYRQDPLVRAAQDLREAAYDFARQEEEQRQQLNLLELGMTKDAVLKRLGPPSSRKSTGAGPEENIEVWTYQRSMHAPAVLTFTDQKLTEIRVE